MTSVKTLNPKAEVMGRLAALFMNINASKGLLDVMKTNLGPKGTIKMLVGGGGGAADGPHAHNHLARPLNAWLVSGTTRQSIDQRANCSHPAA